MEVVPEFDLYRPASIDEAAELAREHNEARFLAGGTDLIVNLRRGIGDVSSVIDLSDIAEMKSLEASGTGLRIGAGLTLDELASSPEVVRDYPVIAQAAGAVAGPTHRQFATVGGNLCLDTRCIYYNQSHWWRQSNEYCLKYKGEICHVAPKSSRCFAAFSGDLAPALLLYDATVDIIGPAGKRTIPLQDLYQDDGADHLTLAQGEFVVSADVPLRRFEQCAYEKVRIRDSIDFPLAGVAVGLSLDGESLEQLEIAFTGTNCRPIKISGLDAVTGAPLDDDTIDKLLRLAGKQIKPMKSTSAPSTYRRAVAARLAVHVVRRMCGLE